MRRERGKSVAAQLSELVRLGLGGEGLSPAEYYRYRLYDDARYTWEDKRRFLSDTRQEIGDRVCNPRWGALTDDKLLAAALLTCHGIRVPEIRAVYHRSRGFPGATPLRTREALAAFLRETDGYPLFAKPAGGAKSRGTSHLEGYDAAGDRLLRVGAPPIAVEAFAGAVDDAVQRGEGFRGGRHALGYMLQGLVRPHPEIARLTGGGPSCVRAYTGIDTTGPQIFALAWKVGAPGQATENFGHSDSLITALDPKTGEVVRALRGVGPDQEELELNPHTGLPLLGFQLPHFDALLDVLLRGATLYPEVRLLGWDVAIGPEGPVVYEANRRGAFVLAQLATGVGLGSDAFRAFVARAEAENPERPRGWHRFHRTRHVLRRASRAVGLGKRRR